MQNKDCSSSHLVLDTLCNWNFGRTFGACSACAGLAVVSDDDATAAVVLDAFESMSPSLEDALPKLVSELVSVSFAEGPGPNSFVADVTLAAGVVADDIVYNKIVYQLSRIFDVRPGVISWSTEAKRQASNTILLTVVDEAVPSASSSLYLSCLGLLLLLINVF